MRVNIVLKAEDWMDWRERYIFRERLLKLNEVPKQVLRLTQKVEYVTQDTFIAKYFKKARLRVGKNDLDDCEIKSLTSWPLNDAAFD